MTLRPARTFFGSPRMTRALRFAAVLAAVAWTAGPTLAQDVSITSTPPTVPTTS